MVTCVRGPGCMFEDWEMCMRMVTHIQGPGCVYMLGYACTMAMTFRMTRWFMLAYMQAHHVHHGVMCVHCACAVSMHASMPYIHIMQLLVPIMWVCSCLQAYVCLLCGHLGRARDAGMHGGGSMHG